MSDILELQRLLDAERAARRALEAQLDGRTRELQRTNQQLEKANVTLAAQSAFAESIVSAIPVGIMVLGGDLRVITANPTIARMFEATEADILGRHVGAMLNQDALSLIRGAVELGRPVMGIDLAVMLPSCDQLFVKLFVDQLKLEGLNESRILIVMDDITGRKRMEAALRDSEARFRGVVEHAADALFVFDEHQRLVDVNQAACDSLGVNRDVLLNRRPDEVRIIQPEAAWYAQPEGVTLTIEAQHTRRDGAAFPVEARVGTFTWRRRRHVLAMARDITERKNAEAQLTSLNEELRLAMNKAIEASQAKSEFLANMSHELRTPLNAIIGYTELLQDEAPDYGADDLIPDLERIHVSANHLLGIINDILDLSKIEAGKVELFWEDVRVADLLHEVRVTITPLAEKKRNAFYLEGDADLGAMKADVAKLRQCLINLLGNACKFTEDGVVTLRTARRPGLDTDWITFEVTDTGIGISPDKLATLFDAFTQADGSITRKYGGTGLGLAITRHFCELMGGSIEVESAPGQGSTFRIRIPARTEQQGLIPSPHATAVALPALTPDLLHAPERGDVFATQQFRFRGRVLVIDDDPATQRLLQHHLTQESFLVHLAGNGREGVEMARRILPDLITLDVMMPGMDGWSVLAQLKEDPDTAAIPVILITLVENRERGYTLGAAEYLVKPVERARLQQVLRRCVAHTPPHTHAAAPHRILVVDDDPDVRAVLSRMLEKEGFLTATAEDGAAALRLLQQRGERFDLMLLDLMMPELDGFAVIEQVRKSPDLRALPIVVVTAKDLNDDERLLLHQSVEKVVQKASRSQDDLMGEVHNLLERVLGPNTTLEPRR